MQESLRGPAKSALVSEGLMLRAMKAEPDGFPKVGRSGREPGVRIDGPIRDLPVEEDVTVEPGTGGMSVALDGLQNSKCSGDYLEQEHPRRMGEIYFFCAWRD